MGWLAGWQTRSPQRKACQVWQVRLRTLKGSVSCINRKGKVSLQILQSLMYHFPHSGLPSQSIEGFPTKGSSLVLPAYACPEPFAVSVSHQSMTAFLDVKIKLTQEIFLNRAQRLNGQCYKYHRTKVYFRLYFSVPDVVKATANTQTFLWHSSRMVHSFFGAILNCVLRFT